MASTDHSNLRDDFGRFGHAAKDTLGGFKTFILRGNVVDLAVGIVIGAAFTSVVNGLVSDIITPLIPVPGASLATLHWSVPYNPKAALNVGAFINAIISFLIVAAVLYFFVVRPVTALMARYKPKQVEAPQTRDCPYCLQDIPLQATRCAYCTSPVPPVDERGNTASAAQSGGQGRGRS